MIATVSTLANAAGSLVVPIGAAIFGIEAVLVACGIVALVGIALAALLIGSAADRGAGGPSSSPWPPGATALPVFGGVPESSLIAAFTRATEPRFPRRDGRHPPGRSGRPVLRDPRRHLRGGPVGGAGPRLPSGFAPWAPTRCSATLPAGRGPAHGDRDGRGGRAAPRPRGARLPRARDGRSGAGAAPAGAPPRRRGRRPDGMRGSRAAEPTGPSEAAAPRGTFRAASEPARVVGCVPVDGLPAPGGVLSGRSASPGARDDCRS